MPAAVTKTMTAVRALWEGAVRGCTGKASSRERVRIPAERNVPSRAANPETSAVAEAFTMPAAPTDEQIVGYWNARSDSYSCSVCEELGGPQHEAWRQVLQQHSAEAREAALRAGRAPRVLDLGCGPGFFSILFAQMGCAVDAVDSSAGMLAQARRNNQAAGTIGSVAFHEGDIERLPFADASFDVVALRNVTWLMRDPRAAYREWRRVLVPGGALLVFDANWYRYLDDPALDAQRVIDQACGAVPGLEADGQATKAQEARCEQLALGLPFTYIDRPAWDVRTLYDLGFSDVRTDEGIWRSVWTEGEQGFYGSSPLFLVKARR